MSNSFYHPIVYHMSKAISKNTRYHMLDITTQDARMTSAILFKCLISTFRLMSHLAPVSLHLALNIWKPSGHSIHCHCSVTKMFWAIANPEVNLKASSFPSKVVVCIYNFNDNLTSRKVISEELWQNLKWFSMYQWRLKEHLLSRTLQQFCFISIIDY